MGIDAADYDGDGKQDVIITALSNETYPLYRNAGEWLFDYATHTSGVAQITILGSGWGIKFIDADNDGRRDVFVAQSHVLDTIEKTTSFLKYKQTPLLMRTTIIEVILLDNCRNLWQSSPLTRKQVKPFKFLTRADTFGKNISPGRQTDCISLPSPQSGARQPHYER